MPTNNANIGITYIDANTPPLTPSDDEVYFCKQSESIWVGDTQHSIGPLEHDITTYSFDDGIDSYFKKVVSTIVPVQAGSGTPSPTNARAISGFTECTVTDCGKNLFDGSKVTTTNTANWGVTWNSSNGTLTIEHKNTYSTGMPTIPLALGVGTYIFSTQSHGNGLVDLYVDGAFNKQLLNGSTFTLEFGHTYNLAFPNPSVTTVIYQNIQIERGSTATDYTPYMTPTTATISFGAAGTVYGGKVDLISGKLMVDRGYLAPTAVHQVAQVGGVYYWVITIALSSVNGVDGLISSHFENAGGVVAGHTYIVGDGKILVAVPTDQTLNTKELANVWLRANNPQFVYKLATPKEYQLTPAQLRSLVGANRLTSSTGEVTEVEYIRNETISWVIDQIQDNSVEWTVIP